MPPQQMPPAPPQHRSSRSANGRHIAFALAGMLVIATAVMIVTGNIQATSTGSDDRAVPAARSAGPLQASAEIVRKRPELFNPSAAAAFTASVDALNAASGNDAPSLTTRAQRAGVALAASLPDSAAAITARYPGAASSVKADFGFAADASRYRDSPHFDLDDATIDLHRKLAFFVGHADRTRESHDGGGSVPEPVKWPGSSENTGGSYTLCNRWTGTNLSLVPC